MKVSILFFHTCTRVSMDIVTYVCGSIEGQSHTPQETCWYKGRIVAQEFLGLSTVHISLGGSFSLLWEP